MGTFILRPTQLTSGGTHYVAPPNVIDYVGWNAISGTLLSNAIDISSNNLEFVAQCFTTPPVPGSGNPAFDELRFSFAGTSIYLDGASVPIAFNDLPAGFTPITAAVKVTEGGFPGVNPFAGIVNLEQAIGVLSPNYGAGPITPINSFSFDYNPVPSAINLINDGCGIRVQVAAVFFPFDANGFIFCNIRVEGTYAIISTAVTFTTTNPSPVAPGNVVTVTPTGPMPLIPDDVTAVTMAFIDPLRGLPVSINVPIFFGGSTLTFEVPSFGVYTPTTVTFTITSTQFGGSVTLGTFTTLFFLNAPGIYHIIPGQAYDTLYNRIDGGTVDVQIPDPYGKTGFVP